MNFKYFNEAMMMMIQCEDNLNIQPSFSPPCEQDASLPVQTSVVLIMQSTAGWTVARNASYI